MQYICHNLHKLKSNMRIFGNNQNSGDFGHIKQDAFSVIMSSNLLLSAREHYQKSFQSLFQKSEKLRCNDDVTIVLVKRRLSTHVMSPAIILRAQMQRLKVKIYLLLNIQVRLFHYVNFFSPFQIYSYITKLKSLFVCLNKLISKTAESN